MMTKYKLSWKNRWKYFLVFPLMVLFFTCSLNNSDIAQDNNDEVFDIAEVMPEFPGGMMEFRKFIAQNLIYPPVAAEKGVEAKIWLQFVVSEDGSVQDPVIVRTDIEEEVDNEIVVVGYTREMVEASSQKDALLALEEEALRVTKSVPHFKPGMNEGKAVKVRYTFPIVFVLQ